MFTFDQTKAGYAHLWDEAKIGSTHINNAEALARSTAADRILPHKSVYQRIEAAMTAIGKTVPWWVIACNHYRESDLNFATYLGNGHSLAHVTTEVPSGRG